MNRTERLAASLGLSILITVPAQGAFQLSQDGLTIYDTANNITWLADANTPATNRFGLPVCSGTNPVSRSCINASGSMNYAAAGAWVAAMNAANYLGHRDWRAHERKHNRPNGSLSRLNDAHETWRDDPAVCQRLRTDQYSCRHRL